MLDKTVICTKFVNRGLPLVRVDEQFLHYTNIVERMDAAARYHDIGPIRINLHSLISSIRTHAIDWKSTLGGILAEKTVRRTKSLRDHMAVSLKLSSDGEENGK